MLDLFHIPGSSGNADVQMFIGASTAAGNDWQTWQKPRGKAMCDILLIGKGGNGGAGVIGLNSTAAGGGGGGSGGQTRITMPLSLLPDALFLSLAGLSATTTLASYIAISPKLTAGAGAPIANDTLMIANGGGNGGNATGATAGTAGAAGAVATVATMPLGWQFSTLALAGQAGIAGGTTGAAGALTLPLTGLLVTGGTGGAGLGAAGVAGTAGGAFTAAGQFPAHAGGTGAAAATTPPGDGTGGYQPISKLGYWYGGTGGGSTHGTATGAGLRQAWGAPGSYGCGGGGGGGALTGSAAGQVGMGGPSICIITCW